MSRQEIQKLLGGYATGTLTPEERQALFEAALEDQDLFDALAREQPLHDLLRDPAARAHLLAALDGPTPSWRERLGRWVWGHAMGLAAVACLLAVGGYVAWQARWSPKPILVAEMKPTSIDVTDSAAPAPAPTPPKRAFDVGSIRPKPAAPELPAPPPAAQVRATMPAQPPLPAAVQAPPPPAPASASTAVALAEAGPAPKEIKGGMVGGVVGGILPASSNFVQTNKAGARSLYFAALSGAPANAPAADSAKLEAALEAAVRNKAAQRRAAEKPSGANLAAAPMSYLATANLGIRYQVLRKTAGGGFEELASGSGLNAGDVVKVQFEPNEAGYLYVGEIGTGGGGAQAPLLSTRVERLAQVATPEITLDRPGSRELQIVFSRQGQAAEDAQVSPGGRGGRALVIQPASTVRSETDMQERTTYVVNAAAGAASTVPFTIRLSWR